MLDDFSDEELAEELSRRGRARALKDSIIPLENIDYSAILASADEFIIQVLADGSRDDEYDTQFIFDVLQSIYGVSIFSDLQI